ncbi:hypothetical protein DICVIV_04395 [Dictyocaulus viviparus]|uniref:Uncharacterized protein n=1 Tax=Dictyocaulus viviparus TaxID=29172 RepID=A0A0D8XXS7_DICVI|nr:hypothetical protein DICVIV_04395 [Dictyocaulus viviparus]
MRCVFPTLDKPLERIFRWYTHHLLVDYYMIFIIVPVIVSVILGYGFIWIDELTVLDARRLYTPISAPSWKEERLWPVKAHEFLPERTFEWRRYLYLVVHGRLNDDGSYPNILDGQSLQYPALFSNSIVIKKCIDLDKIDLSTLLFEVAHDGDRLSDEHSAKVKK